MLSGSTLCHGILRYFRNNDVSKFVDVSPVVTPSIGSSLINPFFQPDSL